MEELRYTISFSQANNFNQCARNWAWKKVDKLTEPISWYTFWGSRMHKQIEDLFSGENSRSANADNAFNFIHGFDEVKVLAVEKYVERVVDGIKLRGYIDLYFECDGDGYVVDWKSKASAPSEPSEDNWRQVQLYAFLTGATRVCIYYPEYDRFFIEVADPLIGLDVFDNILNTARTIIDTKAMEIKGDDQVATPNKNCFFCPWQDRCNEIEAKALAAVNQDFVGIEEFSDAPFL